MLIKTDLRHEFFEKALNQRSPTLVNDRPVHTVAFTDGLSSSSNFFIHISLMSIPRFNVNVQRKGKERKPQKPQRKPQKIDI